jgi:Rps23 Pro-64 3,4-dihydroxylase Tpa1-like proline 4-hydroxylase
MIVQPAKESFLVIDETFDEVELAKIWEDIESVQANQLFEYPSEKNSAYTTATEKPIFLKQNHGVFLDPLLEKGIINHIPEIASKLFWAKGLTDILIDIHPALSIFSSLNYSRSLLSYYANTDHYKPHTDNAVFTILTWLYKEPKSWTGGDLVLNNWDITIEPKHNRSLVIPSSFTHEVTPVKMMPGSDPNTMGRYCISQFGFVDPRRS